MTTKNPFNLVEFAANPFALNLSGGEFAFIRGHVSTADESVKDRKFHVSSKAAKRQIDLDEQALNAWTAIDMHALIFEVHGVDLPITVISAAMQTLDDKIEARKSGSGPSRGPSVTYPVVTDKNGRHLIRAVQDQRSGGWSLEICNAEQSWTGNETKASVIDHKAEAKRKLDKNIDGAIKQSHKWLAQETKTQSLSSVCALINKTIPCEKIPMRRFTLIGRNGSINCDSIAIGGQVFTDMFSVVATFRPDLSDLFTQ